MTGRRPRRAASRRALGALALSVLGISCAGRAWDPRALEARFPELAALIPHQLGDVTPYLLPARGTLTLFLCRWTTEAPIPVSLPLDASDAERRALEAALVAWERAGLGVRFVRLEGTGAPIEIALEDEAVATAAGAGTGNTVADCALGPWEELFAGPALPAELVRASIRLARRTPPDPRGRVRELAPEELAGAALHELGHALGFQGHARRGATPMVAEVAGLRRLGAGILAGEPFSDATLRALYAVPSGTVLARAPVEAWRTDLVDRTARLARSNALAGPFVRVGDRSARIFWRDERSREYGLPILNVAEVLRRPGRLLVVPEPLTRSALPRSRDLGP